MCASNGRVEGPGRQALVNKVVGLDYGRREPHPDRSCVLGTAASRFLARFLDDV
jgi:hypothetical protein